MGRVEGKVCLVTGAASGIGRAIAERLAVEGGKIIATDISLEGEKTVKEIEKKGGNAMFLSHDVTSEQQWMNTFEECCNLFGGIDVLINNAGVLLMKPLRIKFLFIIVLFFLL